LSKESVEGGCRLVRMRWLPTIREALACDRNK